MLNTPQANRAHVVLYGRTNSGKSALFNAILGTDTAIVSPVSGTTTDSVAKAMELIPYGPIVLVDTAGMADDSALGTQRMRRTLSQLERADLALYVTEAETDEEIHQNLALFQQNRIPVLLVFSKQDLAKRAPWPGTEKAVYVSVKDADSIDALRKEMAAALSLREEDPDLLKGLVPEGGVVLLITPIDSAAPKGRMILPQVQLIRACLDNGLRCHVTVPAQIPPAVAELGRIDLAVTDSQAFAEAERLLPKGVPLTSFSILMARQKGGLPLLLAGVRAIGTLRDGDKILVAETCTHARTHEDIGRVKIPAMLKRVTGKNLAFDFCAGRDYPENLGEYALVVHCGGCMITRRDMENRLKKAAELGVPITNYGLALACGSGILDRSVDMLRKG